MEAIDEMELDQGPPEPIRLTREENNALLFPPYVAQKVYRYTDDQTGLLESYAINQSLGTMLSANFDKYVRDELPKQLKAIMTLHYLVKVAESSTNEDEVESRTVQLFLNIPVPSEDLLQTMPTPAKCRENYQNYTMELSGQFHRVNAKGEQIQFAARNNGGDFKVLELFIMLGSVYSHVYNKTPQELQSLGESINDPFGYFLARGSERLLLLQEKLRNNKIHCYYKGGQKNSLRCHMTCLTRRGNTALVDIFAAREAKYLAPKWGVHRPGTESAMLIKLGCFSSKNTVQKTLSLFVMHLIYFLCHQYPHTMNMAVDNNENWSEQDVATLVADATAHLDQVISDIIAMVPAALKTKRGAVTFYLQATKYATLNLLYRPTNETEAKTIPEKASPIAIFKIALSKVISTEWLLSNMRWSDSTLKEVTKVFTEKETNSGVRNKGNGFTGYSSPRARAAERLMSKFNLKDWCNVLFESLFPQMSDDNDIGQFDEPEKKERKLVLLNLMTYRYVMVDQGYEQPEDRDSWTENKLEMPARVLDYNVIHRVFNEMRKTLQDDLFHQVYTNNNDHTILDDLRKKFAALYDNYAAKIVSTMTSTNVFFGGKSNYGQRGVNVTDIVKRDSSYAAYASLFRIVVATKRESKQQSVRLVNLSQVWFACIVDTPHGTAIGLVKNKTVACYVSNPVDEGPFKLLFNRSGEQQDLFVRPTPGRDTRCLLNGGFLGYVNGPAMYARCHHIKLHDPIYTYMTVRLMDNTLHLYLDGGRPMVPFHRIDPTSRRPIVDLLWDTKKNDTNAYIEWSMMLKNVVIDNVAYGPCVEFVDAFELQSKHLAYNRDHIAKRYQDNEVELEQLNRLLKETTGLNAQALQRYEQLQRHQDTLNAQDMQELEHLTSQSKDLGSYASIDLQQRIVELEAENHVDYMDLHPSSILSVSAASIPHAEMSQTPRNNFQAQMQKQAMDVVSTNSQRRLDSSARILAYGQLPFYNPFMNNIIGNDISPSGQMVRILFAPVGGETQEDAVLIKKEAAHRGMFAYQKVISKSHRLNPYESFGSRGNPLLNADGTPRKDHKYMPGEPVIGVLQNLENNTNTVKNITLDNEESGQPVHVIKSQHLSSVKNPGYIHVILSELRQLEDGGKIEERYAQKSTGKLIASSQMPSIVGSTNNVTPDIIVSNLPPLNRKTMNFIDEFFGSKGVAMVRAHIPYVNASSFNTYDDYEFGYYLMANGFDPSGKEEYINPQGYRMEIMLFTGYGYSQVLKHIPADKMQIRGGQKRCRYTQNVRQPCAGRIFIHGQAQRAGIQEQHAFMSHNAPAVVLDRLCQQSDETAVLVCQICDDKVTRINENGESYYKCVSSAKHPDKSGVRTVSIPHATIYVSHLFAALGINVEHVVHRNVNQTTTGPGNESESDHDSEEDEAESEEEDEDEEADEGLATLIDTLGENDSQYYNSDEENDLD